MKIMFTAYLEPVGKARARVFVDKFSGKIRSANPTKTTIAENIIRMEFMAQGPTKFAPKVPLKMTVIAYRSRPGSLPKKVTFPVTRPDADNYGKLVLDALNQFAYSDDSQVVDLHIKKRFCRADGVPRVEIEINEIAEAVV